MNLVKYIVITVLITVFVACSSSDIANPKTAEGTFKEAMKLFNDEDYLEAKNLFDNIKLQFPASQLADDAQYYLAESHFLRDEYVLASFHYRLLQRVYPGSPFIKKSLYKAGLCYYKLSPPYDRDQEYTKKAIKILSEFQSVYPNDSLAAQSMANINELRNKLGQGAYSTAVLYRKLRSPYSAKIYYDIVIDEYYDSKFLEDAYFGKIEVLVEMKKYDKATGVIDLYYTLYKQGKHLPEVKRIESELPKSK